MTTYIFIVLLTSFFTLILNKKFEVLLPFTLFVSILTIFITGILNCMLLGLFVLIVLSLASPFLTFLMVKKKKISLKVLRENLLTPGLLIFSVIYLYVYILNFNHSFTTYDEFSHWGPMVQHMVLNDSFYDTANNSIFEITHQGYPPGLQNLEYLFCKLEFGFADHILYNAESIFILSIFFPALSKYKANIKNSWKIIIFTLLIVISPILFYQLNGHDGTWVYFSIYKDNALAAIFAFCLFLIWKTKIYNNFDLIYLSISLSVLCLVKDIGIVLMLFLVVICFLKNIIQKQRIELKQFLTFLLPTLIFIAWKTRIKIEGIDDQDSFSAISKMNPLRFLQSLIGIDDEFSSQVKSKYLDYLFNQATFNIPIPFTNNIFLHLNPIVCLLLIILFTIIGGIIRAYSINQCIFFVVTEVVITISYWILMLYAYMTSFTGEIWNDQTKEVGTLVSYKRYQDLPYYSIFLFFVIVLLVTFLNQKRIKTRKNIKEAFPKVFTGTTFVFIISIALTNTSVYEMYSSPVGGDLTIKGEQSKIELLIPPNTPVGTNNQLLTTKSIINSNTGENSKIFIVTQTPESSYFPMYYQTSIYPRRTQNNINKFCESNCLKDEQLPTGANVLTEQSNVTPNMLLNYFTSNYDYVYIGNIGEQFPKLFQSIFNTPLGQRQLYKVAQNKLERIV